MYLYVTPADASTSAETASFTVNWLGFWGNSVSSEGRRHMSGQVRLLGGEEAEHFAHKEDGGMEDSDGEAVGMEEEEGMEDSDGEAVGTEDSDGEEEGILTHEIASGSSAQRVLLMYSYRTVELLVHMCSDLGNDSHTGDPLNSLIA
mmetsp:Transcript_27844/g.32963  ORF Transcript_27844/g.32963 Transcript_27844/m.32963 type:complete len:147 (+) Transcript_27844:98-538(+)